MKTIFLSFLTLCFFCTASVYGQKNEVSFHAGGGLSTLGYSLSQGDRTQGFGGEAGVGYIRFLSRSFGVGSGVSLSLYNASAAGIGNTIANFADEYGDSYELRTSFTGYNERQQALFLRIPLTLQYRGGGRHPLYVQAGVGLNIPVSARYEASAATLHNEAYYPTYDVAITLPSFMGLGDFTNRRTEDKLTLQTVYTASVETGIRWRLAPSWALYTALYADYGLNDAVKDRNRDHFRPNATTPDDFALNSVLVSRQAPSSPFAGSTSLIAIGLKFRIAFTL
ncbi:MAG: hypothetical protein LBS05_07395 [Tannerellaceae bacterium]|jgi:hypothetical protein|nr:hypothetical protein [Tannerellaceae bacterium]